MQLQLTPSKAMQAREITVVGAGVVGLFCAISMQRAGHDVLLVDRGGPGEGCSFGNAGSLSPGSVAPLAMPGILSQVPSWLLDPHGPLHIQSSYWLAAAPWMLRFLMSARPREVESISHALKALLSTSIDLYRRTLNEVGGMHLLRRTGQLQLYSSRAAMRKDDAVWHLRRARGVDVQEVDSDDIRQLEPAVGPDYRRGVYLPNEGMIINPFGLSQLLAEQFVRNGGEIRRADVDGFHIGPDGPTALKSSSGDIPIKRVVVAAGAWSRSLAAALGDSVPLQTQRGYHVTISNSGASLTRPVVAADAKCFVTPMEMGIRIAGTVEVAALGTPPNFSRAKALLVSARRMVPALDGKDGSDWMGDRPCLPDSLPVIGPATRHSNVIYAFGHGHLGLTGAPMTGEIVAAMASGAKPPIDVSPFRADRFGSGNPLFPNRVAK